MVISLTILYVEAILCNTLPLLLPSRRSQVQLTEEQLHPPGSQEAELCLPSLPLFLSAFTNCQVLSKSLNSNPKPQFY